MFTSFLLPLRIAVAVIFIYHGWRKIQNPAGISQAVFGGMTALGFLLGAVEVLGAIAVLVGFQTHIAAALLGLVMIGALYHMLVKWKVPFHRETGAGWEFDLMVLAACVTLFLS